MSDAPGGNPFAAPDDDPKTSAPTQPGGTAPSQATPAPPYGASAPHGVNPTQPYGTAGAPSYGTAPGPSYGTSPGPSYGTSPAPQYGAPPTQPYGTGAAPTQPYGQTPARPYGAPGQAYGTGAGPTYGQPTGFPYGTAPGEPYGAAADQPYGGNPADQPYGAAAGQAAGTAPGQPYGAAPTQPYGEAPAPAYGGAPAYPAGPTYGAPSYPAYPGVYPTMYPGYAPPPQGTDGVAIAALATTLGGLVLTAGMAAPVGLGLGIWGLVRTRRSGRSGKGMSIAAIVVSALTILGWIALIVGIAVAASHGDFDEATGTGLDGTSEGYSLRNDLIPGTCLDVYPATFSMEDAHVVDCGVAHGAEVVMRRTLPDAVELDESGQPTGAVYDEAVRSCELEITALSPEAADAAVADVFFTDPDRYPDENGAYCVLASQDADLQGSIVDHDLVVGGGLSS